MSAAAVAVDQRRLSLWQDTIQTEVLVQGSGPPLVFLHGPWGLYADGDFLASLGQGHTVFAPRHPGTTPGDPDGISQLDTWWDLMVYYGELLDRLGLARSALVGHSFGAMVAAEIAATMPERVSRLVLIDAVGLWRDDLPVKNWLILPDAQRRRALFADPAGATAERFFHLPEDRDARIAAQASFTWAQACTGKFVWPIPDKGLRKHIHRIRAPTLLIWGTADGVVAPAYAQEFAARIPGARIELLAGAGHLPHVEQPERVAQLIHEFLRAEILS